MADGIEVRYQYDPAPEAAVEPRPAGVEVGFIVYRLGGDDALAAKAANLTDGEGGGVIVQTGPAESTRIVSG